MWIDATLRVSEGVDWNDAIWALNAAVEQMADCEDLDQTVEMPDGSILMVNLDADPHKANVYEITEPNNG